MCHLPRPAAIQVDCGTITCTGSKPICCGVVDGPDRQIAARCVASGVECHPQASVIECTGASDCASHEYCLLDPPVERPWSTRCSQWFGGGNQPIVCRTPKDCPTVWSPNPSCTPSQDFPSVKTCS
jgi:hypothetical protein